MTYQENLIYDVGFHKGEDTRVYLREGFRVVAIEANPLLAEEGKKLFAKEIQDGRLTLLNIGVGNEFGELDFWVNDYLTEWSSFDKSAGCRSGSACHSVKVKCIPLTEVFKEYGVPFYFKVDIEGYDIYCLQQIDPACKPKYLSTEAWSVEWLRLLHEKGYTKFKIINQRWVPPHRYCAGAFENTIYTQPLLSLFYEKQKRRAVRFWQQRSVCGADRRTMA